MSMRARHRGYSLIELLVAVSVFSVIALIAFGGLSMLTRSAERLRDSRSALADLQRAVDTLARELAQAAPRDTRDSFGENTPALSGSATALSFVRGGWSNPRALSRASLQRVAWGLERESLVRRHWSVLDAGPATRAEPRELLDGLERVRFRYLAADARWRERWPDLNTGNGLPRAVEFTLITKGHGEIRRIIELVEPPASALAGAVGG